MRLLLFLLFFCFMQLFLLFIILCCLFFLAIVFPNLKNFTFLHLSQLLFYLMKIVQMNLLLFLLTVFQFLFVKKTQYFHFMFFLPQEIQDFYYLMNYFEQNGKTNYLNCWNYLALFTKLIMKYCLVNVYHPKMMPLSQDVLLLVILLFSTNLTVAYTLLQVLFLIIPFQIILDPLIFQIFIK